MPEQIPNSVLDLVRFMCETWAEINKWAYDNNIDGDALAKYPVIQGTRNQMKLKAIGKQKYDRKVLNAAVDWMLSTEADK